MHYPKQHESLLAKANLLGSGKLEVRAINPIREHTVSEDGKVFETVKRPSVADTMKTSTNLIMDESGNIAGYWANGLTVEEREIINKECGVPYFYLNEPINPLTGKQLQPDTRLHITEGQIFNMELPSDVAKFMVLKEVVSTIAMNRQEALNEGSTFYFHSQEEEDEERKKVLKKKRNASKLVDELSSKEKHKVIRIMALNADLSCDPYISQDAAVDLFDEIVYEMPLEVLDANEMPDKDKFILVKSLMFSGYIEAQSADGPYYKSESVFGKRFHLADTLSELIAKIHTHSDLIKAYEDMQLAVTGVKEDKVYVPNAAMASILDKHGLSKASREVKSELTGAREAIKAKIHMWKKEQVIAALDAEGIEHEFDTDDDIKDIKAYYIEHHKED